MENRANVKSKITLGILAHVDAGKTTLSESLLLKSGVIKNAGRVDNRNTFLDTDQLEKERGITIYTKNARFPLGDKEFILIDTPGHVDFGSEMERALCVMDYAILLISAPEGIKPHTKTLMSLLRLYRIPTLIFVNKMDMLDSSMDESTLLKSFRSSASSNSISETLISFQNAYTDSADSDWYESIASCDENYIDSFLEQGFLTDKDIADAFQKRLYLPVLFGSALRHEGTEQLLSVLEHLISSEGNAAALPFSGYVYKISNEQGKRLAFLRITKGLLRVKDTIAGEKINELRIYSGDRYECVPCAGAGEICTIPGIKSLHAGDTFGDHSGRKAPVLIPAIRYSVHFPESSNLTTSMMLEILNTLTQEDPTLDASYNEQTKELSVALMGDVHTQVLSRTILDRFHIPVTFGSGKIVYRETIDESTVGIGHFEPLRHYAEVQLLLSPAPRGSGLSFEANLPEDLLDKNWQRLILTHLKERAHRGVLTGSPITDMKITLVAGRAHIKHTEGGDFRQATYRAIRQGLMKLRETGNCRLLEPFYDYTLTVPEAQVGKAMTDITAMQGTCTVSESDYESKVTTLIGRAPVSAMNGYSTILSSYTRGLGSLTVTVSGYDLCHNEAEVLSGCSYDPDSDFRNPSSSVFCSHGAGNVIPWNEVDSYKHLVYENGSVQDKHDLEAEVLSDAANKARRMYDIENSVISVEEIDALIAGSGGANHQLTRASRKGISAALMARKREKLSSAQDAPKYMNDSQQEASKYKGAPQKEPYLLVDGYNVIHAWDELSSLLESSADAACGRLNDILSAYQAITGVHLIVVYDAYKVKGHPLTEISYHNITVVYTPEAQTADQYIERYAHENASKYAITVVTSDGLEQIIIRGAGAILISSREFEAEVHNAIQEFNERYHVQ